MIVASFAHLVSPEQAISHPTFELVPDMQELGDSVLANMVGVLLRFVPFKRCAQRQKTHLPRFFSPAGSPASFAVARRSKMYAK